MRFNDREISELSKSDKCDFDGILNHQSPSHSNFSQAVFKERYFKLKSNLLFYFRINEIGKHPIGVLVLENANIQYENSSGIPFAFSITYRDDGDRKHIFSGRTESVVQDWMAALKKSAYGYWRSQLILLQTKISSKTGRDPMLVIPHNHGLVRDISSSNSSRGVIKYVGAKTTSFRSHLANIGQGPSQMQVQTQPKEQNLIDL